MIIKPVYFVKGTTIHDKDGFLTVDEVCDLLNQKEAKIKKLESDINDFTDDHNDYCKSLEPLQGLTEDTLRFVPTKCSFEFLDKDTNRYYWCEHEGNFKGLLKLLNSLDQKSKFYHDAFYGIYDNNFENLVNLMDDYNLNWKSVESILSEQLLEVENRIKE